MGKTLYIIFTIFLMSSCAIVHGNSQSRAFTNTHLNEVSLNEINSNVTGKIQKTVNFFNHYTKYKLLGARIEGNKTTFFIEITSLANNACADHGVGKLRLIDTDSGKSFYPVELKPNLINENRVYLTPELYKGEKFTFAVTFEDINIKHQFHMYEETAFFTCYGKFVRKKHPALISFEEISLKKQILKKQ